MWNLSWLINQFCWESEVIETNPDLRKRHWMVPVKVQNKTVADIIFIQHPFIQGRHKWFKIRKSKKMSNLRWFCQECIYPFSNWDLTLAMERINNIAINTRFMVDISISSRKRRWRSKKLEKSKSLFFFLSLGLCEPKILFNSIVWKYLVWEKTLLYLDSVSWPFYLRFLISSVLVSLMIIVILTI